MYQENGNVNSDYMEFVVYCAEGWKESKGVSAEIQIARELGKPIVFMEA